MIQDAYFKCTLCPASSEEEDLFVGIDCFEMSTLGVHLTFSHDFQQNNCKLCDIQFPCDETMNTHLGNF